MRIEFQKIHADAIIPHYAHPGDSGMDLYSIEDLTIQPGDTAIVHTGLKMAFQEGYDAQIRPKSGIALSGVTVANTPGTVDSGYRGEVCVILINHSRVPYKVKAGKKIAQLVISPVIKADIVEVETVNTHTIRGEGGFGSTGLEYHKGE